MAQRQHAQQPVFRLQGQHRRAVVSALAEAVIRQHNGLGSFRRSGCEEQDLPLSVGHALCQVPSQLCAEFLVPPEQIDICVGNQSPQHRLRRRFIQQHHLKSGDVRREELNHTSEAAVREQSKTGFSAFFQFFRPLTYACEQFVVTAICVFVSQCGLIRALRSPVREYILKAVKAHPYPSFPFHLFRSFLI